MQSIETVVNKSGERWLEFTTLPTKEGLLVRVKTKLVVEEFMRGLGDGSSDPVEVYDRYWLGKNLRVYKLSRRIGGDLYRVDAPGKGLMEEGASMSNLSFLRLVGVSEGVEFVVKDVYSTELRRQIRDKVGESFRRLVEDYIKPVRVTLIVSGQES